MAIERDILTGKTPVTYDVEEAILERYQGGAREQQPALCCPTEYQGNYREKSYHFF